LFLLDFLKVKFEFPLEHHVLEFVFCHVVWGFQFRAPPWLVASFHRSLRVGNPFIVNMLNSQGSKREVPNFLFVHSMITCGTVVRVPRFHKHGISFNSILFNSSIIIIILEMIIIKCSSSFLWLYCFQSFISVDFGLNFFFINIFKPLRLLCNCFLKSSIWQIDDSYG
jgi:hypothetical protein